VQKVSINIMTASNDPNLTSAGTIALWLTITFVGWLTGGGGTSSVVVMIFFFESRRIDSRL
jgi:hypothetical protein